MESTKISEINKLFVILDLFSRGSLYRQFIKESRYCDKGSIDFRQLVLDFENILEAIEKEHRETELREKKMFDDYKDYIVHFLGINPAYSEVIEENHVESAKWKKTLIFFATNQPIPEQKDERDALKQIIKCLAAEGPSTIWSSSMKKGDGEEIGKGPTPLHLMVVKEATSKEANSYKHELLKHMLQENRKRESLDDLNKINLDDVVSKGPLLRGKTILNIAARTLDVKAIKLLLNNGVSFDSYNKDKDNMYHSPIRYAMAFPEKESKIIATMKSIELFLEKKGSQLDTIDKTKKGRPESLWRMKNHDGLTPLQLAAKHGRFDLFQHILSRRVYRTNDRDKESLDDAVFDITEIETIPVDDDRNTCNMESTQLKKDTHFSVLFFIGNLESCELATRFVSLNVISKTITDKWYKYKRWFRFWTVVHVLIMVLFSWSAIVRSRLGNPPAGQDPRPHVYNKVDLVIGSSILIFLYGFICFLIHLFCFICYLCQCIRYSLKKPWNLYLCIFSLFGLCIIVDFAFIFDTSSYQNFLLPYNIILGWILLVYFLQVYEMFGFFTFLIRHTAIHIFQFAFVLGTLLIGFSLAMFIAMQKAEPHEEEDVFENVSETFFKMFTIMLGIGEIGVLFSARQPIISVSIFVMYVLMTTLLLLNALIAIMSNTCSKLTNEVSTKAHVQLQRMHAIIHLEMFLPHQFYTTAGKINRIRDIGNSKAYLKRRMLVVRPEDESNEVKSGILSLAFELFHLFAQHSGSKKSRSKRKITSIAPTQSQTNDENHYQNSTIEIIQNSEQ